MGPLQGGPCEVGSRPVPGGGRGTAYPSGGRGCFDTSGRSAPGDPPTPAGSPTFFEESRGKNTRGKPLDPAFIAARSHSLVFGMVGSGTVVRLFPPVCQNRFGTHFPEKYAEKHFMKESLQIRVRRWAPKYPPRPRQCGTNAKTSERQQAGHKTGGSRGLPPPSFSPFLGRNGDPCRAGGPPGAAPRWLRGTPQRVRKAPGAPGRWSGFGLAQVGTCRWVPARSPAGIQAFSKRKPGRKESRGWPPRPPFLWPARSHSLVLAWWGALFRSMGYYGAHVRALIWDAFFG